MAFPPLLVTGYHLTLEQSALLLVDLDGRTYEVLRPYPGPIHATAETLYLKRFLGVKTRLEKYDRHGLCWMRRVPDCIDNHSVVRFGDELALCSTGTNEVIFVGAEDGVVRRRWSPDPQAQADSWHLNSLHVHGGRLYVSCFGRHTRFRAWKEAPEGTGLVLDVASGQSVVEGLSWPHDPYRLPDGWLVNDSRLGRLIHVPDRGPRETVFQVSGFPRGLLVLPDYFVLGVSCPRGPGKPEENAYLVVIDRHTRQAVQTLPVPYPEIGHVVAAPSAEVLESMRQEQARRLDCLLPQRDVIAPADRVGTIVVRGPLERVAESPELYTLPVEVTNHSRLAWATENDVPINISYQVVNAEGGTLMAEGVRTRLPLPVGPGKSLTFPMNLDLTICRHLPAAAAVRITLVQEGVAWWPASAHWSPARLPLPAEYVTAPPAPPDPWVQRWRRLLPA